MPNGGMSFGFMGPVPNMYNPNPYQNNYEQNKLYELEKRIENVEDKVKALENNMPNALTYNNNYDYKTSMNMM